MRMTMPSTARFLPMMAWQQIERIGPLGVIILAHIGFFYALQSGLLHQAAPVALPKEIFATFLTPQTPPQPSLPAPQPTPPKTVPVVKKTVAPMPINNTTPSEQAISVPPHPVAPAAPAEAATPAAIAPPAPAAPSHPKTISSGVEYAQPPRPEYPSASRRMGEEGKVILRVLVNDKGRPEQVEIKKTSGSARLDEAAKKAVMNALFRPTIEDGKAVAVYAILPIDFKLDN